MGVTDVGITVRRRNRGRRALLRDTGIDIGGYGRFVLARDRDRDSRSRLRAGTIGHRVAELIRRGRAVLQPIEGTVRIIAEGAITIVRDLALGGVGHGIDRECVSIALINIRERRRDGHCGAMFLCTGANILRHRRLVLTMNGNDHQRCRRRSRRICYRVAELIRGGSAGLQAGECAVRIVSERAVAVVGHLAPGVVRRRVDRKRMGVAGVSIGKGRGE